MRIALSLIALCVLASLACVSGAATYWVAPDGDDTTDGTSPGSAWASPSRGTATKVVEPNYTAGATTLNVASTEGFLDIGNITVAGQTRAYTKKTPKSFLLAEAFSKDIPNNAHVFDADILGGNGFEPGDVITLRGGTYVNKPLNFYKSGAPGKPITYQSAPGERAILVSEDPNISPVRHLGSSRSATTVEIVLKNLVVRNATEGHHGAPGMQLGGLDNVLVEGCDVDVSGWDRNGDNHGIRIYNSNGITISNCRLRAKWASALSVMKSSGILLKDSIIYESFNGVEVHGASIPGHLKVDHCTFYHMNRYSAAGAAAPGTIEVTNSIITETPHYIAPALTGNGTGNYNTLWHNAQNYGKIRDKGWNGTTPSSPGKNDINTDPKFISLNPASPCFLRIPKDSPAATAGKDGTYMGAFAPVDRPALPKMAEFNVRNYGAKGDGVTDDTQAINKAIKAAGDAGGGKVVFPPTNKHYLLSNSVVVSQSRIYLYGPGATLKLTPQAGHLYHVIHVAGTGPTGTVVEDITIDGLTLDGTFANPVGPLHQRGLEVVNANRVLAKNILVKNVFCGMTFGPGTRNCEAIDFTVTNWDHDAFGASGRGINSGATDIRFIRCKAINTPRCVKGWEIEEGAQRVYLEDCVIANAGGTGTGFFVRHHAYLWPLLVDDVEFVRCSAKNISGSGFLIGTTPHSRIRPAIRTRNIRLIDCTTNAPVAITVGAEDIYIKGGRYDGPMGVGLQATNPDIKRSDAAPVRSLTIENARISSLKINATTGNPSGTLGNTSYPDYQPKIRLTRVTIPAGLEILGDPSKVTIENCKISP